jgi:hypothetical protein
MTAVTVDAAPVAVPVVWMAPFLSGGGYSSEAISYAMELERMLPNGFGIKQFAEPANPEFARGVPQVRVFCSAPVAAVAKLAPHAPRSPRVPCAPPRAQQEVTDTLDRLASRERAIYRAPATAASTVSICHSTPDCWVPSIFAGWDRIAPCPHPRAAYTIGTHTSQSTAQPACSQQHGQRTGNCTVD